MSTAAEPAALPTDDADVAVDAETADKFFRFFQHEVTALQQQMDRLGDMALAGGERIDATEHCMAGIARLSSDVKDASVYLPAHDQKTYAEAIKALRERLGEVRAAFAPRQKFLFKTKQKNPSAISLSDAAHLAEQRKPHQPGYADTSNESSVVPSPAAAPSPSDEQDGDETGAKEGGDGHAAGGARASGADAQSTVDDDDDRDGRSQDPLSDALAPSGVRRPSFSAFTSVSISSRRGVHIVLPASAGHATTTGNLRHLDRCIVDMSLPTTSGRPFAGLTLRSITSSLLICGHVSGAAFVTDVHDCTIVVASRQLRMHDCRRCDVYLQVASRPMIEGCAGVRFAPLPAPYASESGRHIESRWDQVDDFHWQRPGEPSPNWKTLPQPERVPDDVWRETVPGGDGIALEDIFAAVGIGHR